MTTEQEQRLRKGISQTAGARPDQRDKVVTWLWHFCWGVVPRDEIERAYDDATQ